MRRPLFGIFTAAVSLAVFTSLASAQGIVPQLGSVSIQNVPSMLPAHPRGWAASLPPGAVIGGNLTIQGQTITNSVAATSTITAGAGVTAGGAIQAAGVTSTAGITAAGMVQGATVSSSGPVTAGGSITSTGGNVAAAGTVSGQGIVAGANGVTSSGSVLASGAVQGSSLAGNIAGSFVQGAVAQAVNAVKATGTGVICNNGAVAATDGNGNFDCSTSILIATNAGQASGLAAGATISGDQVSGGTLNVGTVNAANVNASGAFVGNLNGNATTSSSTSYAATSGYSQITSGSGWFPISDVTSITLAQLACGHQFTQLSATISGIQYSNIVCTVNDGNGGVE